MKFLAIVAIASLVCLAACQDVILDLPRDAKEVTVRGTVKDNADNFVIDLYTPGSAINLHVNARFGSRWGGQVPYIVLNSNGGSNWNTEVNKGTSLKPGSEFKLRIFFNDYNYDVYLNDEYFNSLPWRLDHASSATKIRVGGDAIFTSITRTFYYHTINSNFLLPLRVNLDTSTEVRIHGRVADKNNVFVYDLENASGIAFHASFRHNENVLVLNNLINNNWQAEQREKLPVARGQVFSHKIVSNSNGFTLSGDDFEYVFARPAASNSLLISGRLSLRKVSITKRL